MSVSVRQDFVAFCNTQKHILLDRYPNATAQEIVALLIHEFRKITHRKNTKRRLSYY